MLVGGDQTSHRMLHPRRWCGVSRSEPTRFTPPEVPKAKFTWGTQDHHREVVIHHLLLCWRPTFSWCWRGRTRRRRGGSTVQVGEGRQPRHTRHHPPPPRIRRWRGKEAETGRGGQRGTGGCLSLVGSCSLVAASPCSCAKMTATPTRSWWQGVRWSSRSGRWRW